MERRKVVLIGASYRGMHGFIKTLLRNHQNTHEVVGILDISLEKIRDLCDYIGKEFQGFVDFTEMVEIVKPDIAIIATIDSVHVDYLEKCLEAGIECIVEKPLCIDAEQCRRVRAAQTRFPDVQTVTAHNLRYNPYMLKIKELVDAGEIGRIRSILFEELLDMDHGASYFRRWNREKKHSGGLIIHKASHHFDIMNWFAGSKPKSLCAQGGLLAYGAKNSPFAQNEMGTTCHECSKTKEECVMRSTLSGVRYQLYKNALATNGYTPDLCVFSPEIDSEDFVGLSYDYENGIHASYSLCAHSTIESMRIGIEGTKGRLEYHVVYDMNSLVTKSEGNVAEHYHSLKIIPFEASVREIEVKKVEGGHGGGDTLLCGDLFGSSSSSAKASLEDGIQAVLIGVAANESIKEKRTIDIQSLASS